MERYMTVPCAYRKGNAPKCGKPSTGFGLYDAHRAEINRRLEQGLFPPILRTHGCGRSFTLEEWFALPGIPPQVDDVVILDQRLCPCGSHLAIPIAYAITPEGREEAAKP